MARQTKREREFERLCQASFNRVGRNIQIPIMRLGEVMNAGKQALAQGADEAGLDAVMSAAIEKVRVK